VGDRIHTRAPGPAGVRWGNDPASGTWTQAGNLAIARSHHTSTLLTNGKVLVAGGLDSSSNALASAELYDSAVGSWQSNAEKQ